MRGSKKELTWGEMKKELYDLGVRNNDIVVLIDAEMSYHGPLCITHERVDADGQRYLHIGVDGY